jgi:hypothetical protein
LNCEQRDRDADIEECDEFDEENEEEDALSLETSGEAEERARQFATIAELLTATGLGDLLRAEGDQSSSRRSVALHSFQAQLPWQR